MAPDGIGCRNPMVPFPMEGIRGLEEEGAIKGLRPVAVGTNGARPVIGVKCESPGVAMEIGVNMARFVPGIMLDPEAIPITHKSKPVRTRADIMHTEIIQTLKVNKYQNLQISFFCFA